MYDSILIPTDGSEHAERAAEHGLYLGQMFDATVHVINAIDLQSEAGPFDAGGISDDHIARLESEHRELLADIEALATETDRLQTDIVRGSPSQAILDYVGEHEIDLLAMGTHGRTGVRRYVAGSVTERVVRKANIPVVTARATERSHLGEGYDDILIPTDGSDAATAAVDHGLAFAESANARVHVLNIVNIGEMAASPSYTPPTELLADLTAAGEEATEEIATQARDRSLDVVTEVKEGLPAKDLLEYADEAGVDLIAMGTQGRTGLNRFILGSTTERVIRHAEMPVLAVPGRE
ncbi:universal stress protein [Halorientalis salina]|uniref:universal stress protein n=1 Tax=Halorientalis salina TaxID=2932266 RepID=UPI0010ABB0A7|nr:universal stress protein [Halorientalis salina]